MKNAESKKKKKKKWKYLKEAVEQTDYHEKKDTRKREK